MTKSKAVPPEPPPAPAEPGLELLEPLPETEEPLEGGDVPESLYRIGRRRSPRWIHEG